MVHSPVLQELLEQLLSRYRVDPKRRALCLTQESGDQLLIEEEPEQHQVRFSRFITRVGRSPLKIMEVLFYVSSDGRWIPYAYYRHTKGRRIWGRVDQEQQTLTITDLLHQTALRDSCDIWAFQLRDQGWLQHATPIDASGVLVEGPYLWPEPTVDEPDDDQLEEWLIDSVCEATDGCLIKPDGVCPHGHPSWLLRLGLI